MATFWKRSPQTVRPSLSYKTSVLFCLVVFAFTAIVVYWRGHAGWGTVTAQPTYTATAYLVPQSALSSPADSAADQPNHDSRIRICQTADTPERALAAVKSVADRRANVCRAEWKSRAEKRSVMARQTADDARKAYAEATSQLNAFRQQADEAARLISTAKPSATPVAMIDNPQWLDLQEQLSALQRRYDELLVDRTPLHPAVQEVAARMAGIKEQMAVVGQRIPAARENASPSDASSASSLAAGADHSLQQDKKKWSELAAAVERTHHACSEAELAEKVALQAQQATPSYALEAAQVVANHAPANSGWRRLLSTTLATSLLMALGFGSFTAGAGIEPPITNVAELETDLDVTVLGTVRAFNVSTNSAERMRRRSRIRNALIALGLILMCMCPVIAIWGMVGM